MKIPAYIQNMMERSNFARGYGDPGYTLEISKETRYTRIDTLRDEINRLVAWVERQVPHCDDSVPTAVINSVPSKTHYCHQHAVVTIYDPVMMYLERYIRDND